MAMMLLISSIIMFLAIVVLGILIFNQSFGIKGFSMLLEKFVEVNQEYYQAQAKIVKKQKEIIDSLTQQFNEINNLRKILTSIESSSKNLSETNKLFKDNLKTITEVVEDMRINAEVANDLSKVSNNIRLLDNLAVSLKKSIEKVKE